MILFFSQFKMILSLKTRFVRKTNQTGIVFLFLNFLLQVSQFCKSIDYYRCSQVRNQNIEESPVHDIRKKSAVVTVIALPTWCLTNDSLSK